MKADMLVTGGLLVDGTGAAPQVGDVAVADGRIIAVGDVSAIDASGAETLDAQGCIVTPGFVDIHTHYDGQAIWADRLRPSTDHGVTTVVIGNCGVGFAPCRPGDHDALIGLMEGVEDIPGVVMAEGLDWSWESFEDFLDAVDARPHDCDIAAYLPHSPLRVYVMGERGIAREPASESDLSQMRALAARAIDAGALGCATSRLYFHRTADGELIPSFNAGEEELHALAAGIVDAGGGVLQLVPNYENPDVSDELDLMARIATHHEITVTFTGTTSTPGIAEMLERRRARGADLMAQIFPRPIGMVVGLDLSWNPFRFCDAFEPLVPLSASERAARMRDPALRATLIAQQPDIARFPLARQARNFANMFPMTPGFKYEPDASESVADRAAARGVSPEEEAYDLLLEDDGGAMLLVAMGNYVAGNLDSVGALIGHEGTVLGLGDGGAHYALICDASYPTSVLIHWVRDRKTGRIALQDAVRELTSKPASVVGLQDRGILRAGCKADLNVIDLQRLELHLPYAECDLPAGGKRLLQDASGYRATILSGQVTYRDGKPTGALPGKLVRGRQHAPG
ncbi:amidohydrolase [Novosphingobium pentaromativorans US6-1]|nr:amidohydrolase [Novosphingobium pentaromativorans US6-1]